MRWKIKQWVEGQMVKPGYEAKRVDELHGKQKMTVKNRVWREGSVCGRRGIRAWVRLSRWLWWCLSIRCAEGRQVRKHGRLTNWQWHCQKLQCAQRAPVARRAGQHGDDRRAVDVHAVAIML